MALHMCQGQAPTHGAVADVLGATMDGVRLATKTTVEGLATGTVELGEATPIVAPTLVSLKMVGEMLEDVRRNKERLEELHGRCVVITTYVIIRCNTGGSKIDVTPLEDCVQALRGLAARVSVRGTFAGVAKYRPDKTVIEGLRDRIEGLVPAMELTGVVRISEQLETVRRGIETISNALKGNSAEKKTRLVSTWRWVLVRVKALLYRRHIENIRAALIRK